jgi:hypothetical protein
MTTTGTEPAWLRQAEAAREALLLNPPLTAVELGGRGAALPWDLEMGCWLLLGHLHEHEAEKALRKAKAVNSYDDWLPESRKFAWTVIRSHRHDCQGLTLTEDDEHPDITLAALLADMCDCRWDYALHDTDATAQTPGAIPVTWALTYQTSFHDREDKLERLWSSRWFDDAVPAHLAELAPLPDSCGTLPISGLTAAVLHLADTLTTQPPTTREEADRG